MAAISNESNDPAVRRPTDTGKALEHLSHYQFVFSFFYLLVLISSEKQRLPVDDTRHHYSLLHLQCPQNSPRDFYQGNFFDQQQARQILSALMGKMTAHHPRVERALSGVQGVTEDRELDLSEGGGSGA